jgi:hypothetical protein
MYSDLAKRRPMIEVRRGPDMVRRRCKMDFRSGQDHSLRNLFPVRQEKEHFVRDEQEASSVQALDSGDLDIRI